MVGLGDAGHDPKYMILFVYIAIDKRFLRRNLC